MGDEHVEFFERAVIEQQFDSLSRRQLAAGVLRFDPLLAAAKPRGRAPPFKPVENMFHVLPWLLIMTVIRRV